MYNSSSNDCQPGNMYRVSKRKWRQRIMIIACIVIFFFILSKVLWRYPSNWEIADVGNFELFANNEPPVTSEQHERWIVVTTVNSPSKAIKVMSEITGWWMVVVGDKATPSSEWDKLSLPNVIYLDLIKQKKLGYAVNTLLTQNNYARKVIGYLFAIQHGAHYIFDSDDDTIPIDQLHGFNLNTAASTKGLLLNTKNLTYNPCPHFGQSTLWPRGYPLNRLSYPTEHNHKLCMLHDPVIRQGMINQDPDVDAILRLTRKPAGSRINLNFDSTSPPIVIPKGTFVPLNTQSSIITYEALWSLVLPQSLPSRTIDIIRGYWAQPLLWLIDERVGYYTAMSLHDRNPHNLLTDAEMEHGFYNIESLLQVLKGWSCSHPHFFACISNLSSLLVHEGFWQQIDLDLINAWLTDLAMVGYFPPNVKKTRTKECVDRELDVQYYSTEQKTSMIHSQDNFIVPNLDVSYKASVQSFNLCNYSLKAEQHIMNSFKEVLLVIGVNDVSHIPILETWYRHLAQNILYCVGGKGKTDAIVSYVMIGDESIDPSRCLNYALGFGYNVSGYIYTDEHSFLHLRKLSLLSQTEMWMSAEFIITNKKTLDLCHKNTLHCKVINKQQIIKMSEKLNKLKAGTKLKTKLKTCFDSVAASIELRVDVTALVDQVMYLPERLQKTFSSLANLFLQDIEMKEYTLIIPLVLNCLELTTESLTITSLYDGSGHFYFPAPIEQITDPNTHQRRDFCKAVNGFSLQHQTGN